jgi:hypothetical protein
MYEIPGEDRIEQDRKEFNAHHSNCETGLCGGRI